jgi:hypothetical protein
MLRSMQYLVVRPAVPVKNLGPPNACDPPPKALGTFVQTPVRSSGELPLTTRGKTGRPSLQRLTAFVAFVFSSIKDRFTSVHPSFVPQSPVFHYWLLLPNGVLR